MWKIKWEKHCLISNLNVLFYRYIIICFYYIKVVYNTIIPVTLGCCQMKIHTPDATVQVHTLIFTTTVYSLGVSVH